MDLMLFCVRSILLIINCFSPGINWKSAPISFKTNCKTQNNNISRGTPNNMLRLTICSYRGKLRIPNVAMQSSQNHYFSDYSRSLQCYLQSITDRLHEASTFRFPKCFGSSNGMYIAILRSKHSGSNFIVLRDFIV